MDNLPRLRMEAEVPWDFNVTSYVFDIHNKIAHSLNGN